MSHWNFRYAPQRNVFARAWQAGRPFLLLTCVLLDATAQQQQRPPQPQVWAARDIWAESLVAGGSAGYYHETTAMDRDRVIATSIETDLIFNRLESKVEMKSSSRYREGDDGRLLGIHSVMSSSAQPTTMDVTVKEQSLAIRTSTGGKAYERTLEFTGEVLGPEAARRLTILRLKSPGDVVLYQMFVPELASVTTITNTLAGIERIAVEGERKQALKIEQTMTAMPGKSLLWLDETGWLLRLATPSPFGDIETVLSSAEKIAGRQVKGATLPAESFGGTLATSNVRLPEERLIEQLKIRITHKKPELGWPDFSTENQKVLESARDHVVLEIRRVLPNEHGERPLQAGHRELTPSLEPNALLQSDDANIRDIAAEVVGDDHDAYSAARKLQQWTTKNMKFDPGIAVAPASEVARDRRGTCFGYAMLLGSLARAAGIPSRVRMGLVYAGGVWGGHAWVDVWAGRDWIPLDAALYSPGPADAARFSFFTSTLQEGAIAQVGSLAKLYGNVDIKILEYTIHGKQVTIAEDAKPFSISGDTYRNPWLGLTVRKPAAFRFSKQDAPWPASTVIAMEGPENREVEIQSHSESLPVSEERYEQDLLRDAKIEGTANHMDVAGHRTLVISSTDRAGLVLKRGGDVFLVKSTGPRAIDLLMDVVSTLKIEE